MTNKTVSQTKLELCCSFCSKDEKEVKLLIAGAGVYICDECVDLCNKIISHEIPRLAREEAESLVHSNKTTD